MQYLRSSSIYYRFICVETQMFLYMFFLLAKKQSTSLAQDEITKSAQEYKKDLFPKYKQEKNVPKNFEMS